MPRTRSRKAPYRPLAAIKLAEHMTERLHRRVADLGPCDDRIWVHRWTDWTEQPLGEFVYRSRECRDCKVLEGVVFHAD